MKYTYNETAATVNDSNVREAPVHDFKAERVTTDSPSVQRDVYFEQTL
jgi:hypothetical protein